MSFPHHDRLWVEVADFLDEHVRPDDRVLAPDRFWWRLACPVNRWVGSNLGVDATYDWVVVHKGDLDAFPKAFLRRVAALRPAFANEVFVVFTSTQRTPPVERTSVHVAAFDLLLESLPDEPAAANPYEADPVEGAGPRLARFADMDDASRRAAQNEFFRQGGYRYVTARDRAYYEDVHAHLVAALRRWSGGRVLDLACGSLALPPVVAGTSVVRADMAEEGVRLAAVADRAQPGVLHATVDGHDLAFADASFDAVSIVDSIEHVRDATRVLQEVARVLRPGGELLLTWANRDSINQVMTRKLGWPGFWTNHQHILELSLADVETILGACGFDLRETAGVSLLPYWGIPGVDEAVREITDEDPEVVAIMRELGRRAGAEFAYTGVGIATKTGRARSRT